MSKLRTWRSSIGERVTWYAQNEPFGLMGHGNSEFEAVADLRREKEEVRRIAREALRDPKVREILESWVREGWPEKKSGD